MVWTFHITVILSKFTIIVLLKSVRNMDSCILDLWTLYYFSITLFVLFCVHICFCRFIGLIWLYCSFYWSFDFITQGFCFCFTCTWKTTSRRSIFTLFFPQNCIKLLYKTQKGLCDLTKTSISNFSQVCTLWKIEIQNKDILHVFYGTLKIIIMKRFECARNTMLCAHDTYRLRMTYYCTWRRYTYDMSMTYVFNAHDIVLCPYDKYTYCKAHKICIAFAIHSIAWAWQTYILQNKWHTWCNLHIVCAWHMYRVCTTSYHMHMT